MKTFKIIILFIICIGYTLEAQDRTDPASILPILDYPASLYNFNQTEFVRGWNWGSESRKLDSALKMNTVHTTPFIQNFTQNNQDKYRFPNGTNWVLAGTPVADGDRFPAITQAQAMQYEPSIRNFDTTNNYTLPSGDVSGSVFGFLYNNPIFNVNQNVTNNLVLRKQILTNNGIDSALVLSNPWPNGELFTMDEKITEDLVLGNETIKMNAMNGTKWYLSLRIKALNQISSTNLNDTVLKIRIPYQAKRLNNNSSVDIVNSYISFDSLPNPGNSASSVKSIMDSRTPATNLGYAKLLSNSSVKKREFAITRAMLKKIYPTDTNSDYITVSASFTTDGVNDSLMQNSEGRDLPNFNQSHRITNMGIDVVYCGKEDVAIDWIRIETPQYQELVRGRYDALIASVLRNAIDTVHKYRPDQKIYRFCSMDEFWVSNWHSQRYFNKLVGGNLMGELGSCDANRFLLATDFKEFWGGNLSMPPKAETCMPYIYRTDKKVGNVQQDFPRENTLGLSNGVRGLTDWRAEASEP